MDTIESEEKIVWSNGMIAIAENQGLKRIEVPITEIYVEDGSTLNPWRHGFGNLGIGRIIAWISEKRPLFLYIKYNFYLFRTQIYMDLRRFILI
ncbi:MAG: hypothetical protein WA977_07300 [Halobacteriota archaeon]